MRLNFLLIVISIISCFQGRKPIYTQIIYLPSFNRFGKGISLSKAEKMLSSQQNMIIFGPKSLEFLIFEKRKQHNTVFIAKDLEQNTKSWIFSSLENMKEKLNQIDNKKELNKQNMITISKIFLMAQALNYDKFNSNFFIWVDAETLYQSSQNAIPPQIVLKYFYELVQPQWIFFTYFSQKQRQFIASEGQQKYIGRRLMIHESVNPSFMGGNVQIIKDIKNSYQNFLRILLQSKQISYERNVFSLMPIKYPGLIPNTVSIDLADITDKIHMYNQVYRIPKSKKYFNGFFQENGQIVLEQQQIYTKYSFDLIDNKLNVSYFKYPQQVINSVISSTNQIVNLKQNLLNLTFNQFKFNAVLIDIILLGAMLIVYVVILVKNFNLKSDLQRLIKRKKSKEVCYMKVSDHAHEVRRN